MLLKSARFLLEQRLLPLVMREMDLFLYIIRAHQDTAWQVIYQILWIKRKFQIPLKASNPLDTHPSIL